MATSITYLLVANPKEPGDVQHHTLFSEYEFEHRETITKDEDQVPSVLFRIEQALEEQVDLEEPVRKLSRDFPNSTVVICEVEERFEQVEHLQTNVFINGKRAGNVEHGYIFNVGGT